MNSSNHSKFQIRINRHIETIHSLQKTVEHRNLYRATANAFIRKLLKENRITKDELRDFFRPLREYQSLPETE